MCTVVTLFAYLVFQFMSFRKATLADANKKDLDRLSLSLSGHIEKTEDEFKIVSKGIDTILNKLNEKDN